MSVSTLFIHLHGKMTDHRRLASGAVHTALWLSIRNPYYSPANDVDAADDIESSLNIPAADTLTLGEDLAPTLLTSAPSQPSSPSPLNGSPESARLCLHEKTMFKNCLRPTFQAFIKWIERIVEVVELRKVFVSPRARRLPSWVSSFRVMFAGHIAPHVYCLGCRSTSAAPLRSDLVDVGRSSWHT